MSDELLGIEAALATVLAGVEPVTDVEELRHEDAVGRTLAADLIAPASQPSWAACTMDGYAVRSVDVAGASRADPVRLTVVGEVRAGQASDVRVLGSTAIRVATGAPLPPGADAVIPVEEVTDVLPAALLVHAPVRAGNAVRPAGSAATAGDILAPGRARVTPAVVALAASAGIERLAVRRLPIVAVLACGDEIRPASLAPDPAGLPDACGPMVRALVRAAGARAVDLGITRDDVGELVAGIVNALATADIIVVSGGVSSGRDDIVRQAFDAVGHASPWRVSMRPGRPFAFGRAEVPGRETPVLLFGLPGNPVASLVLFEVFVRPTLHRLEGRERRYQASERAVLEERVANDQGRRGFQPVTVRRDADGRVMRDGAGRVRVRLSRGSGGDSNAALAKADGLVVIPESLGVADAGTDVELRWFDRR